MSKILDSLLLKDTKTGEATEYQIQDSQLKARVDNLIANAGNTDDNAELIDIRVGEDGTQYPTAGEAVREQVSKLKQDLAELYHVDITIGKNKLNPEKVELYKAIETAEGSSDFGNVKDNTNSTGVSELIEIPDNADHIVLSYVNSKGVQSIPTFSNPYGFWFYKSDGSYDSHTNVMSADIPSTACYVRIYCIPSYATASNRIMVEFSSAMTEFETYTETPIESGKVIDVENKIVKTNTITVGIGKDFEDFVDAVESVTDSSIFNRYIIEVYEGEYQTVDATKLASDYKGLIIPDYVSIIGIGDRNNIVIKGTLPSDADPTYANVVSALNLTMNGTVENITIKAKNVRYCNHDDGSTFGMVRASHKFKNCKFVMEMNDSVFASTAGHIVGIGSMKNKEVVFESCVFENYRASYGILIHDNNSISQESGARLVVDKCNFVNKNGQLGTQCICISNSGGNQESYAEVLDSNLYNGIRLTSASTSITSNRWKLFACGNNNYKIKQTIGLTGVDLSEDITAFNNVVIS